MNLAHTSTAAQPQLRLLTEREAMECRTPAAWRHEANLIYKFCEVNGLPRPGYTDAMTPPCEPLKTHCARCNNNNDRCEPAGVAAPAPALKVGLKPSLKDQTFSAAGVPACGEGQQ